MANLTAQAIEFMLVTGMSDDPKQDVSQLPVMEQVAIYCMNYTQQQSDTLTTQQSALSQITDQINNNNYVSQLAEIRSKILSGDYSWPTDAATSAEMVTALNKDAVFGNWPTPPAPSASTLAPAISYDDYQKALANGQGVLSLLIPAPTDGTAATNTWPSDPSVLNALVNWCKSKDISFPPITLTTSVGTPGPTKLQVPAVILPFGSAQGIYVWADGEAYTLTGTKAPGEVTVTSDQVRQYSDLNDMSLYPAGAASSRGVFYTYLYPKYGYTLSVFVPDGSGIPAWSEPSILSTANNSGKALPLVQDDAGNTYIWTTNTQLDYASGSAQADLAAWIAGKPWMPLVASGQLALYEPPPTPGLLQQWSSTFTAQQDAIDSNNRQLNSAAQGQMLEVQLAGTDYTNGQQYASGALGKKNDSISGIIRNF